MTKRHWTLALAFTLVALPVLAGHPRPRGGNDRSAGGAVPRAGGSAANAADRVTGGVSGAIRAIGAGSRPVPVQSYDRAVPRGRAPAGNRAEYRHPRAGTGHGWRDGAGYYYGRPYYGYYSGYWGYPYYSGWGWDYPYWGWGYYPSFSVGAYFGGGPYYGGGSYYGGYTSYSSYADTGSLRLIVDPPETRVFVDGYYSGTADDYDGVFQRLDISRGRHELTLKLEGYQTHRLRLYVTPGHTLKIRHDMVRGEGGETFEDLATGYADAAPAAEDREPRERAEAEPREEAAFSRADGPARLRLDVRPDDATVYVDGEFRGQASRVRELELPPGRHLLEVVRPGYRTYGREIELRPGRTESVGVDLVK